MEIIKTIFENVLYQHLFNGLIYLYQVIPGKDLGIAIIVLTLLIKTLLYPLEAKAIKSQRALSESQPKIKEIQEKYKNDKEKQTKEILEFYKREKINPFSGCLPLLIQLPILIALFRLFYSGLNSDQFQLLYSFVPYPGEISTYFLGVINLANPVWFLAILAGVLQFFQTKAMLARTSQTKKKAKKTGGKKGESMGDNITEIMQKQMQFFLPIFTVMILFRLPGALGLYWATMSCFTITQQYIIKRKCSPQNNQKSSK